MLRSAGLRATAARLAVMKALLAAHAPRSHAEVCEDLADAGIDRVTIWRNLVDLTEAGLVRRSDHGDHLWRFELSGGEHPVDEVHPHFVCTACGTVACLPAGSVMVRAVKGAPKAIRSGSVDVQVRGTCNSCAP